ncbi:MAG TPA: hypothetical protein VFM23_03905 [Gemmatimonadales bacterium]|nr:hypothetical protein [Gemmatimonadales bacterium]
MAATLATGTAAGQSPRTQEHRGFWIGFGVGGGVNLNEGLDGERLGGGSGYIRLGGTPSQRVLLGFEGYFWGRDQDGATIARGNGSFIAQFYPSESGGGFLKGGVGVSSISRASTSGNTTTTTSEGGFGLTVGAGWDVRLGNNLYLAPTADLLFQWFESKTDPILGDIPGRNTLLLFGLGLTWH